MRYMTYEANRENKACEKLARSDVFGGPMPDGVFVESLAVFSTGDRGAIEVYFRAFAENVKDTIAKNIAKRRGPLG